MSMTYVEIETALVHGFQKLQPGIDASLYVVGTRL